jgi:hypothetical protein
MSEFVNPERWFEFVEAIRRGDPAVAAKIVEYERRAASAFQLITPQEFTPTVYQLKANGAISYTASSAVIEGYRVGRLVTLNVYLAIVAAGTAASAVWVTLPPAFPAKTTTFRPIGSFLLLDSSASTYYTGTAVSVDSGTAVAGISTASAGALGSATFTAALASGDFVGYSVQYLTTAVL